jgi:enamine deaminase RidA (YjgF/YER057c/UK114 family)
VERHLVPAESPFAARVGYSRALRIGPNVHVAGTAPIMRAGAEPPADAYGQAKRCLELVVAALTELGAAPAHVVRTRVFLTSAADWEEVGRAHGEVFGDAKPVTTFVVISALLDSRWLVEVEAEAFVPEAAG